MKWTIRIGPMLPEPLRERLLDEATATYYRLEAYLARDVTFPPVSVSVTRARRVIPELGIGGSSQMPRTISVRIDPTNDNFENSLEAGQFVRTLCHEFHHCLRHEMAGYGRTLGEALVTEGLADQFDREMNGGEGQIWDHAIPEERWPALLRRAEATLFLPSYNHPAWFFGRVDGTIPRWTGYTVGYHLLEVFLANHSSERPSRMGDISARDVIESSWPLLRAEKGFLN